MKDQTHELARQIVEFYLKAKGRQILPENYFPYPADFIKKHKLEKRFQGHSFDILTVQEIIEITDYKKHSKTNQKINDGIVDDFVWNYIVRELPSYHFYVLQKEEIVDSKGYLQPTAAQYLRDNLF